METENRIKTPIIIVSVLGVMLLLFFVTWGVLRKKGFGNVIKAYVAILIFVAILVGIVCLVIFLFKKQRKDMMWIMRQRIISACKMSTNGRKQSLMLRGMGEDNLESRFVGFVTGMAKVKSEPLKEIIFDKRSGQERTQAVKDEFGKILERDLIVVSFKKTLGFLSFLSRDEMVLAPIDDFSNLNGDIVWIRDSLFAPKMFEFFVPAKYFKETYLLDEVAKNMIYRYEMQELLTELGEIGQDFLGISPQYQKEKTMSRASDLGFGNAQQIQQPPQG